MQPTPEMKEWFETRTNQHIELVQKYAERIRAAYPEEFADLDTSSHDAAKFEEPEYTPYVYMTWKRLHPEFEYSEAIAEAGHQATLHHVRNNPHHPEYWTSKFTDDSVNKAMSSDFNRRDEPPKDKVEATSMPEIAIAEMCADWCAMSEEMENSPQEWADKNIGVRWEFTPKQIDLIHTLLNTIWETPEPLPERAGGGQLYGGREEEPPKKKSAAPPTPSKRVLPPESHSTPTNEFGGFFGSLSMALPWSTARKMEVWDVIYKRVKERYWKTSVAKKGGDFRLLLRDFLDSEYGASIASDLLAAAQFSEFILLDTAKRCSMRSWDRYWSNWLEFAGWK